MKYVKSAVFRPIRKSIQRCHNAMKFGVVNKSTILNRFVLHTLQRNFTHLVVITRKTNIKLFILKGGTGKEPRLLSRSKKRVFKTLTCSNWVVIWKRAA